MRIEAPEFLYALGSNDPGVTHYLDVQTGEVVPAFDRADFEGVIEQEDLGPVVDDDPERFRYIDPASSHQSYRWMENFANAVEEAQIRERLVDALDRPRPFRRFKDELLAFPEVRERWFRSEEAQLRDYAEGWLLQEGIQAELVDPKAAENA